MKKALVGVIAACLLFSTVLVAHHGTGNAFGTETIISRAVVTKYVWVNPHVQIGFRILGTNEEWNVEGGPVNMMAETGWTRKSLKPGDAMTISYNASRNGAKIGFTLKVVTADGTCLARTPAEIPLCETK